MKTTDHRRPFLREIFLALSLLLVLATVSVRAHEGHHHHPSVGPNGGRVLIAVEPHLEFFVQEDRTVRITALDDHGKAVPIGDLVVRVTSGGRLFPTRLGFERKGDVLVSDRPLPEGDELPIVVRIEPAKGGAAVTEKFHLDLRG